jgi:hypothetical protein
MRNSRLNRIATGTLSVLVVAGALTIGSGAATAAQTKPKLPPPAPKAAPVKPPVTPPVRPPVKPPVLHPDYPDGRPPVKPQTGTKPEPQPRPGPGPAPRPVPPGPGPAPRPVPHPAPVVDRNGKAVPPAGSVRQPRPGGGETIKTPDGRVMETNGKGQLTHLKAPNGTEARFSGGRMTSMHKVGTDGAVTDMHRSPSGVSTIKTVNHDPYGHAVTTVGDGHRGYRERDLLRRPGYRQRTYFANGQTRVVIYHDQTFVGYGAYPVYVPAYSYSPGFYAYFGSSWGVSVSAGWGAPPPVYGGYFVAAAGYTSPNAYVADYMINQNLQENAAQQQDAQTDAAADGTQPAPEPQAAQPDPIPQQVRDTYSQEVQATTQQEQAAASGKPVAQTVPGALDPDHKVFQSYSDVEATNASGQECAVTGGDFVQREEDTPDAQKTVAVTVVAIAKPSSSHCAKNVRVRLSVDTLQDWYNSYNEQHEAGMEAINAAAGKNGIPAMPNAGKTVNPMGQGTADDSGAMASAMKEQGTDVSGMQAQVNGGGQ